MSKKIFKGDISGILRKGIVGHQKFSNYFLRSNLNLLLELKSGGGE